MNQIVTPEGMNLVIGSWYSHEDFETHIRTRVQDAFLVTCDEQIDRSHVVFQPITTDATMTIPYSLIVVAWANPARRRLFKRIQESLRGGIIPMTLSDAMQVDLVLVGDQTGNHLD